MLKKICKKKKDIALMLPRLAMGVLFLVAGCSKLFMIGAPAFALGVITPGFGINGIFALILAWFVILVEIIGGVALLIGKFIPSLLYKLLIALLMVILLVATIFVHIKMGDMMGSLSNLVLMTLLIQLSFVGPVCPFGITGLQDTTHTCNE